MPLDFLITGSSGLLGSSLVEYLANEKRTFVGVDRGESPNQYIAQHEYVSLDLTDFAATSTLLDRLRPKVVIHGAAMTAVDLCETQRELAWSINVEATANLARCCTRLGIRLVYVSTDYVFDGEVGGYREAAAPRPLGVYAVTKHAGELAVQTLANDWAIGRTSVPFGPFPHVKKDFVRWLRDELAATKSVRIVTDQVSNPTFAPDLARMLVALADSGAREIVHTAGATSIDRYSFAQTIARKFGLDEKLIAPIKTSDLRQASPRPLNASLLVDKAKSLGLAPLSIEDALTMLQERSK